MWGPIFAYIFISILWVVIALLTTPIFFSKTVSLALTILYIIVFIPYIYAQVVSGDSNAAWRTVLLSSVTLTLYSVYLISSLLSRALSNIKARHA